MDSPGPGSVPIDARAAGREPLLSVRDLHVGYGSADVIRGIDLDVHAGEFVTVLGRNGAGKSTLMHALSGLIPTRSGAVRFDGHDITRASPRTIVRSGLVQVLEGHRVFTGLSIEDNLVIGAYARRDGGRAARLERAFELFPELATRRAELASRLSGGQQQMLAVAQGILGEPRLLILDEPSGGLAPLVVDRIVEVAAQLAGQGTAILLVEQMVDKALRHAHHGYVLETGRIAASGTAAEIRISAALQRAYLGHDDNSAGAS